MRRSAMNRGEIEMVMKQDSETQGAAFSAVSVRLAGQSTGGAFGTGAGGPALRTCTVTLPLPPDVLWPNQAPGHWGEKTAQRAAYRLVCRKHAEAAWGTQAPMLRAQLGVWFVFCGRRRDADNCLAAFKAGCDGLVDAGILPTDSPRHLVTITVATDRHQHGRRERCSGGAVQVTLQELGEEQAG